MSCNEVAQMGWSMKGARCHATRSGLSSRRMSFMSAISLAEKTKFVMPIIFEGCCNRSVFGSWLTSLGQSLTKSEPMKDRIIILDNATFHKGVEIENIASRYGLHIMYLPPYSPELNPIEKCWAVLKSRVRILLTQGLELYDALVLVFKSM